MSQARVLHCRPALSNTSGTDRYESNKQLREVSTASSYCIDGSTLESQCNRLDIVEKHVRSINAFTINESTRRIKQRPAAHQAVGVGVAARRLGRTTETEAFGHKSPTGRRVNITR